MGRVEVWGRLRGNYNLVFDLHHSTLVVMNQYLGRNNNSLEGMARSYPVLTLWTSGTVFSHSRRGPREGGGVQKQSEVRVKNNASAHPFQVQASWKITCDDAWMR